MKEGKILLAMKKRGFGEGKWNGVGGKLENNETIKQATLREAREEICIDSHERHLHQVGSIKFYFNNNEDWDQHVHIFVLDNWTGEPTETEEMKPQWFSHHEIPFDDMWLDDKYWLPRVLEGKKIEGEFYFNKEGSVIEKFEIREI